MRKKIILFCILAFLQPNLSISANTNSGLSSINIEDAWEITKGSKDVTVAIIDSGIDLENHEFNSKIVYPYNVVEKNQNVQDTNGHGTHVSGIIAASDDGIGITGVAPNISIMPIKAFDKLGDLDNFIEAIQYACDNGADIVNCSIAIEPPNKNRYSFDFKNFKLIDNYYENYKNSEIKKIIENNPHVLFIFPAGNGYKSNAFFPARYDLNNIISVAAVDSHAKLWKYGLFIKNGSNYNSKNVDIGAPGVDILSTGLKGAEYKTGTSMATAYVSGICALLKSKYPTLSSIDIKNALLNSSQYCKSLKNKVLTNGIVDAGNALKVAQKYK